MAFSIQKAAMEIKIPDGNGGTTVVKVPSMLNETKDAAISAIDSAKTTAVSAVSSAQTTAVNAVTSAQSTAVSDIESKGATTLASIPSDYTDLSAKVDTNAADITTNKGDISSLEEDVSDLQTEASEAETERDILKRRVRNLELASQGITHTVEEDSDTAYCKTVPSGAMPNCILDSIGGRSLVWNQRYDGTIGSSNGSIATINDTAITCTVSEVTKNIGRFWSNMCVSGHKYYICVFVNVPKETRFRYGPLSNSVDVYPEKYGEFIKYSDIFSVSASTGTTSFICYINGSDYEYAVGDVYYLKNIQLFDLTQLFGSAWVSSRTDTQLKADIEQLISEKDYWPYDEGTVISGDVQSIEADGYNIFKPEWCPVGTSNGVTITALGDGKFRAVGTATGSSALINIPILKDGTYGFYADIINRNGILNVRVTKNGTNTWYNYGTFNIDSSVTQMLCYFAFIAGKTYDFIVCPMIVRGSDVPSEFVPYHDTYTYSAPSSIKSQSGYGLDGNVVDFDARTYTQTKASRAYQSGDEDDSTLITDGTTTIYPLDESVTTDLSDILPETTMLTVEEGGTLTFKSSSDLHIAVPSTESYMVKTSTD